LKLLRSLLFNIFFYVSLICVSVIIILLYPFISTPSLQIVSSYWIKLILYALKVLCGVSWTVNGIDNIPNTPCIIVSNHQGQWESFFLQTLKIPSSSIIKKELLYIPFFGWALACLKPIHLRRRKKYISMKKVIKDGSKKLKKGTSIIIFPEGTRIDPKNGLNNFSNSCGVLSVNNQVPILPVCHNSGLFWKNKKFAKDRGVINVEIGKPIFVANPKKATDEAYRWINSKFKEIH